MKCPTLSWTSSGPSNCQGGLRRNGPTWPNSCRTELNTSSGGLSASQMFAGNLVTNCSAMHFAYHWLNRNSNSTGGGNKFSHFLIFPFLSDGIRRKSLLAFSSHFVQNAIRARRRPLEWANALNMRMEEFKLSPFALSFMADSVRLTHANVQAIGLSFKNKLMSSQLR